MTSIGEKEATKENPAPQLSAKLTAACSNQSRASRMQASVKYASAQQSDRKTVYSSAKNSNLRAKHDKLLDLGSSISGEHQIKVTARRNGSQHKTIQPESQETDLH